MDISSPKDRPWGWIAATLALLLGLPTLWGGLQGDDITLLYCYTFLDPAPQDLFAFDGWTVSHALERGAYPWWTVEHWAFRMWRPIASLTHSLDFALWPDMPGLMHAQSLAWSVAAVVAVGALYRRLLPSLWLAGLATVLFAIDDAHGSSVGWLAARGGVLATLFCAATLWAHDRWIRDRWRPGSLLGPVFFALSLLSWEGGLATAGFLFALTLFRSGSDGEAPQRWPRLMALLPYAGIVALWRTLYVLGDYGAVGSGVYRDVSLSFLFQGAQNAVILAATQLVFPFADVLVLAPANASLPAAALSVLVLAALALALGPLWARSGVRIWALALLLSGLPFGAVIASDRYTMIGSIACMGLLAEVYGAWSDPASRPSHAKALIVLGAALHLVLAPLLYPLRGMQMMPVKGQVDAIVEQIPQGPQVEEQTVVLLTLPMGATMLYPDTLLELEGRPRPRHLYWLYEGSEPVELTRVGPDTLELFAEGGWMGGALGSLFRPDEQRFSPGDEVVLEGMKVRIIDLGPHGRPVRIRAVFPQAVDSSSMVFLSWGEGGPEQRDPPAVGASVRLPAPQL